MVVAVVLLIAWFGAAVGLALVLGPLLRACDAPFPRRGAAAATAPRCAASRAVEARPAVSV